ncbi:short transient receptor potential channel 4-like [Convolutriloba macropyga]|uniref:short transient receptor potential channel 4-like n=1 Tax=Convolutriloba macropyga TaxID=536237 RepID=UPI003F5201CA
MVDNPKMEELSDWIHFQARQNPSRESADAVQAALLNPNHASKILKKNYRSKLRKMSKTPPKAILESEESYLNNFQEDEYESSTSDNLTNDTLEMSESKSSRRTPPSKEIEDQFMTACMKGDVITVENVLKYEIEHFDFHDARGFTPLMHAIKNGQEELVKALLSDPRIRQDDCLLAAVDSGNYNITRFLIEYGIDPNQEAKSPVFGHGATPLILACIINHVELIRLLLDKNAERLYMEPEIRGTTLYDCRKRIKLLQALSSPAYIALTCDDPVSTCFQLSKLSRWLGSCENELAEEYFAISEHCETLAAEFVNAVEDSFDIMTLLSMTTDLDTGRCGLGEPLCRLKEALTGNHKKFIAHSHCQLALADEFIKGMKQWRHLDSSRKFRSILLMILLTPIWALFCIVLPPHCRIAKYLKIPFMKFIANITTYLIVILIIVSEQVQIFQPKKAVFTSPEFNHGSPFRWREVICLLWLLGQIVEEIRSVLELGTYRYLTSTWKMMDMLICIVFSVAFISRSVDAMDLWNLKNITDRQQWGIFDPLLVYEAAVCIGTLLSVNRILNYFRAHRQLGKLQMSLGSSFGEITKFMALFVVMYLSFAAAINALYWKDQFTAVDACYEELGSAEQLTLNPNSILVKPMSKNVTKVNEKCPFYLRKRYQQEEFQFQTIGGCLYQLYWTLFGYSDIVFASKVYRHWTLHTLVGSCLFIMFNFLAVVVLLNVLIGMITKVLDKIEDNIDVEWKYARSSIYAQFINDSYCLPPPFNIVPTMHHLLKLLAKISQCCCASSNDRWLYYAKPHKLENLNRKRKQEGKLEEIVQSMKDQYLRNEQKEAEKEEVTIEHVDGLRNDVSGLKFEILGYVRHVPQTLVDMTDRQHDILKDLSRVKNKQNDHENQLHGHSKQLDAFHELQMGKLNDLDKSQQNEFHKVILDNQKRIKEATDYQTEQANLNTQSAKERIIQAKEEQLVKVELIYQKQEAYFTQLKIDQDNIMARQAIESQNYYQQFQNILNKLQRHEKRLDEVELQGKTHFTHLETHNDSLIHEMNQKQEKRFEQLKDESTKLYSSQAEILHQNQKKQLDATQKLQKDLNEKFFHEMEQMRNSYEQRIEVMMNQHRSLVETQNEFIKSMLYEAQNTIIQCTKNESERIIGTGTSTTNIPSLFSGDESAFGSNLSLGSGGDHDKPRSQILGSKIPTLTRKPPAPPAVYQGYVGNLVGSYDHTNSATSPDDPKGGGVGSLSGHGFGNDRQAPSAVSSAIRKHSTNAMARASAKFSMGLDRSGSKWS